MKNYQVKLYRKGDVMIILTFNNVDSRHRVEEVARDYIKKGLADSMGAIDEISNL